MSIVWLQPIAWLGLAALAIPLLIHLLARQQSRRVRFPSLKFLRATRLAALRRRTVSDLLLLVVRTLIVSAAVAALLSPVFVSSNRRRAWDARVSRAIVIAPAEAASISAGERETLNQVVSDERAAAFAAAVFEPAAVPDGVRDAVRWLGRQEPSRREIVVVGHLRAGAIEPRDLREVPASIGMRLLPLGLNAPRAVGLKTLAASSTGEVTAREVALTLDDTGTVVTTRLATAPAQPAVEVRAAPAMQGRVEAALGAVLAEGVRLPREGDRRIVIEFSEPAGAAASSRTPVAPLSEAWMRRAVERMPELTFRQEGDALVIGAGVAPSDARAVHLIARAVAAAWADPLDAIEPRLMGPSAIAALSRPPAPIVDDVRPADEGGRRLFWALALVLVGIEQVIRRTKRVASAGDIEHAPDAQETRVA